MKNIRKFFAVSIIFVVILSSPSPAAQIAKLRVWVLGDIGVAVDAPDNIVVSLGGKNGTVVTVKNIGNVDDIIRIEGSLNPHTDWIKFSFKCAETVGQCDDFPSSQRHTVDNMRITPTTNETQFYLEVEGYKNGVTTTLTLWGYSLTEFKKDELKDITITVKGGKGGGIRELPGINIFYFPLLVALSGLIFYKKMV